MQLRKADFNDKQKILQLANLLYIEMPDFVWNTEVYIVRQIDRGEYFVAEEGGGIVGIISLRVRNGKMYIETLAVAPERQSDGLGTTLIEFAKHFAKEKGFGALCACAFFEYQNKDFYLKKGFSLLPWTGEYSGHQFHRFEIKLDF